MNKTVSSSVAL